MKTLAAAVFLTCFALMLPFDAARAGDEDMMSPYQKFDPETGFFVSVDPSKKQHEQDQGKQQKEQQPAVQGSGGGGPLSDLPAGQTLPLLIGSVLVLGLLAAGFFWYRWNQHKTS